MRDKRYLRILGIYNLALAIGAIKIGISMARGSGIFAEYPAEWLGKIPLAGWVPIGIMGITIFGIGNIIAAIGAFSRGRARPWLISVFMGGFFLISIIYFRYVLGEWYLATSQFLILSILQLVLCIYVIYKGQLKVT